MLRLLNAMDETTISQRRTDPEAEHAIRTIKPGGGLSSASHRLARCCGKPTGLAVNAHFHQLMRLNSEQRNRKNYSIDIKRVVEFSSSGPKIQMYENVHTIK